MPMPSPTDQISIVAGIGVKLAIASAMAAPSMVPMTPPKTDSTTDSDSICAMISGGPPVTLRYATHPMAGAILGLSSTFAGNLLIVGSIANIIVVTAARPLGVTIDFRIHARTGVPVTVATLAIGALWLALRA